MLGQDLDQNSEISCGENRGDEDKNEDLNLQENGKEDSSEKQSESGNNDSKNEDEDEQASSVLNKELEKELTSNVSSKSSHTSFDEAIRCSESMQSSDSNKENVDCNLMPHSLSSEFDQSNPLLSASSSFGAYADNTDEIPLSQLLKIHGKQLVSGFEFGEATKRRAQENMKTARVKKMYENRRSSEFSVTDGEKEEEVVNDLAKPCCSKTLTEVEHKTPHSRKRQRLAESKNQMINPDKDFCKATRRVPDCLVDHPDCIEVWVYMIYKEEANLKLRNPRLFNDFKSVTPRMRAILLDWLMEVAAVYHLRRVTYYLSIDYFDRFLSIRPDIPKALLQLVGITCLYIAAKVEEIYPPNLSEFSYVCDGACKSKEMVSCELLILNSLGWEVGLTTPTDWLNLYMQLHFKSQDVVRTALNMDFNKDFIFPQYSAYQFTRASQLMDLFSLDPGFLKFGYSVIAASSMYYMYGESIALSVSGLSWQQLKPCVDYMEVFNIIIEGSPDPRLHSCLGGPNPEEINKMESGLVKRVESGPLNENYSFQTHIASMEYFEKATLYRLTKYTRQKSESDEKNSEELIGVVKSVSHGSNKTVNSGSGSRINSGECSLLNSNLPSTSSEGFKSLDELGKLEVVDNTEEDVDDNGQNLLSFDEIFEMILNRDEKRNTNSE